MSDNATHTICNPYNENIDNGEEIRPGPPRTPVYRLSDGDMAEPKPRIRRGKLSSFTARATTQSMLQQKLKETKGEILEGKARQKLITYGKPPKEKERK